MPNVRRVLAGLLAVLLPWASAAAEGEHPWLAAPPGTPAPTAYFVDLRDGDRIETPFVLRFGLARAGLAPTNGPVPGAGHHHLLIDRDLPLDFRKSLPFDPQVLHFSEGQMETVLTLPPGEHTLRLLLADDRHVPSFVYSKLLRITVTAVNPALDPAAAVRPGVEILDPRPGEQRRAPFLLRMHASGLNVGHAEARGAGVGHFRIVAERAGAPAERIALVRGQTEAWLAPPPGRYRLRLELVANDDGAVLAGSAPVDIVVAK
jgi:hypothetical protein